jgi:hypothetical protein
VNMFRIFNSPNEKLLKRIIECGIKPFNNLMCTCCRKEINCPTSKGGDETGRFVFAPLIRRRVFVLQVFYFELSLDFIVLCIGDARPDKSKFASIANLKNKNKKEKMSENDDVSEQKFDLFG